MANAPYFGHVVTAMVTPFDDNLKVDFDAFKKLVGYLLDNGSDAVVVSGTTGESATLKHHEKLELFRAAKQAAGKRGMVIAGTGSYSTEETIELTKAAEEIGVDGALLVTPYYNKPSQEGLFRHYTAVSASTKLPVMLYNVPGRTAVNLLPDTVARIAAAAKNVVAVKEASKDLEQIASIAACCAPSLEIYSGDDGVTLPILSVGGVGVVSVISHIAGNQLRKMHEAYFCQENDAARSLHLATLPLTKALFCTNSPSPTKHALKTLGVIPNAGVRLPLAEVTEAEAKLIDSAVAAYLA